MSERLTLPVLALRDVVLFPGVTAPIGAGRPMTLKSIEAALASPDKFVFAVAQKENIEAVTAEGLHTVGTLARIGQLQRGMSGMQLLLHGERRAIQDLKFFILLKLILAHERSHALWLDRHDLNVPRGPSEVSRVRKPLVGLLPPGMQVIEEDGHARYRLNPKIGRIEVAWEKLEKHPHDLVKALVAEKLRETRGRGR